MFEIWETAMSTITAILNCLELWLAGAQNLKLIHISSLNLNKTRDYIKFINKAVSH